MKIENSKKDIEKVKQERINEENKLITLYIYYLYYLNLYIEPRKWNKRKKKMK